MVLPRQQRNKILSSLGFWNEQDELSEEALLGRIFDLINDFASFPFPLLDFRELGARVKGIVVDVSIGFIFVGDLQSESLRSVDGFTFGIFVQLHSKEEHRSIKFDSFLYGIMPVVIWYAEFNSHNIFHPPNGIGACWVKNKRSVAGTLRGVLTCEHVIGAITPGMSIQLNDNAGNIINGTVGPTGRPCIDAVIIDVSANDQPTNPTPLSFTAPVPGMAIDLKLSSGSLSGSILRVSLDPYYFGAHIGHRIFIDCSGTHGDSGSLLMQDNDGVGIYMGALTNDKGQMEGMCQSLEQVSRYFDIDFFL